MIEYQAALPNEAEFVICEQTISTGQRFAYRDSAV
jgi:hypothetical protein